MSLPFVHLHVHSEYSILQSSSRIVDLLKKSQEFSMPGLAITDLGNMYCALDFYKTARKFQLKPIIGFEAFVAEGSRQDKKIHLAHRNYSLLLYAKNINGYHNLLKLCSLGWVEGFFQNCPRIDEELLQQYHADLIAVVAQKKGRINAILQEQNFAAAVDYICHLQEIFGRENLYLEVVNHGLAEDQELNTIFRQLSSQTKAPLVATNDSYYTHQDDAEAHEVLLAIGAKKTMSDSTRPVFVNREFYFKSTDEMYDSLIGYEDACENTYRIFTECNLTLEEGSFHLPKYPSPDGLPEDEYLRQICETGLTHRYAQSVTEKIIERLNFELGVISRMGYSAYFLIVADFIAAARKKGISVGPGRGSAAGSLVAYLTGITNLCPLRYGLYFERFLNPERVSMPDIDIDFCYRGRSDVIQYVRDFYGTEKVAQIITYGTMKTKAVLKDVARVFEINFQDANNLSKCVPEMAKNLTQALDTSAELKRWQEQHEKIFDVALRLEGLVRQTGIHAAGVIIAPEDVSNFVPLARTEDGSISTQFEGTILESQGLLKMDFLGLSTLTVIQDCLRHIKVNRGVEIDIDTIPLDDAGVFTMLSEARTAGLFQVDSALFQGILRQMQPQRFEDIIALVALGRPGPLGMKMDVVFCECRHDATKISYPHPLLQDLLSETYGVLLYQEQVMNTAVVMAGYSMAEADDLRKAMGKKLADKMAEHRDKFVKGSQEHHQISADKSNAVFDLMATFAEYGFNKSHSAAYALICYQTAWLKVHYPQEFMAAAMTDKIEDLEQIQYFCEDCQQMNIKILPPHVNYSNFVFGVDADAIVFGLGAVKGVGEKAVESIAQERQVQEFYSFRDFCHRVDLSAVNKKVVEQLIKIGAFDSFGTPRRALLALMAGYYQEGQDYQKSKRTGQKSLLELKGGSLVFTDQPNPELLDAQVECLAWEKELTGVYFSGHPMGPYREYVRLVSNYEISQIVGSDAEGLPLVAENQSLIVAGMVCDFRRRVSKNSGEDWATFRLVDFTDAIDCVVFARQFKNVTFKLLNDQIVVLSGVKKRQSYNNEIQLIVDSIENIDFLHESGKWRLDIAVSLDVQQVTDSVIQSFRDLAKRFPGKKVPLVYCNVNGYNVSLELSSQLAVSGSVDCMQAFYQSFGGEALCLQIFPPVEQQKRYSDVKMR